MLITGRLHAWLIASAYLYLLIPIVIFLAGWTTLFLALPVGFFLFYLVFAKFQDSFQNTNFEPLYISKRIMFWVIMVLCLWCIFSGIGGFSFQNSDFNYRNAVFHDLIHFPWPVVYCPATDVSQTATPPVLLLYYFNYWLPAACVGKIFNTAVGEFFLFLWTWAGLVLVYYFVIAYLKRVSILPLFIFIFFSGADIVGTYILRGSFPPLGTHLEWWTFMQYSSITSCLYWVFNQAVPAWLGTILFMQEKTIGVRFFLVALVFTFSPFPAIGLLGIFCITMAFELFSWEGNGKRKQQYAYIAAGLVVFIVYSLFDAQTGRGLGLFFLSGVPLKIFAPQYLLFVFLEFFCISFCCFHILKYKSTILVAACILLYVIPFFQIISTLDFVMRVSIPSLFILCVFTIQSLLQKTITGFDKFYKCILLALLVIGSITPISEIYRSAILTLFDYDHIIANGVVTFKDPKKQTSTFCCSNYQSSFYWRYLVPSSRVVCPRE